MQTAARHPYPLGVGSFRDPFRSSREGFPYPRRKAAQLRRLAPGMSGYRVKLHFAFVQEAGFREKAHIYLVGQAYVLHIRHGLCLRIV